MTIRSRVALAASALFVVAVVASASLSAQGQGRGMRGMGPGRPAGPLPMLQRLDLTDAQKEQVRTIVGERTGQKTHETLDTLQHDLIAVVMADTPDTGKIEQLKASINEAEATALNERVDLELRIAQILTAEQRQKARELPAGGRGRGF
jgi:Spy/CpxP family protein refolding chaperone